MITQTLRGRLRFDRNELAGSFGDIGTDLPLIIAMISTAHLDAASVFILLGVAQIATGFIYGLPMPMQPLKAMAVILVAEKLDAAVLYGAGVAIGILMLVLTLSGLLNWLARVVPACVVRGIQMGLGLKLATLAMTTYIPASGASGYALAAAAFGIGVVLLGNRHLPAALPIMALGIAYAVLFDMDLAVVAGGMGLALPSLQPLTFSDIATGLLVLALPQIPLSISNSVIATDKTLRDLFPERPVGIRKIGLTYSFTNLIVPFFGGIPLCHGCGGLAGHHAFGARTGGSVVIYGSMFLVIGLLFSGVAEHAVKIFPQPVLGVMLLFESLVLINFARDVAPKQREFYIAVLVAIIALLLPQGFILGMAIGTLLHYLPLRYGGPDSSPDKA